VGRRKQLFTSSAAFFFPIPKKFTLLLSKSPELVRRRTSKTQRVADIIDYIMDDSIEGGNALASFTDERSEEAFQGGDDSTGKKQHGKASIVLRNSQTP
jgi:hypothetical protein